VTFDADAIAAARLLLSLAGPPGSGHPNGTRDFLRRALDALVLARTDLAAQHELIETLRTERGDLIQRRDALLATIVRVTNETPFADEVQGWTAQRAAMIAEVGTLKAERDAALRERDEWKRGCDSLRAALDTVRGIVFVVKNPAQMERMERVVEAAWAVVKADAASDLATILALEVALSELDPERPPREALERVAQALGEVK